MTGTSKAENIVPEKDNTKSKKTEKAVVVKENGK